MSMPEWFPTRHTVFRAILPHMLVVVVVAVLDVVCLHNKMKNCIQYGYGR